MVRLFTCLLIWLSLLPYAGKSQPSGGTCYTDTRQLSLSTRQLMRTLRRDDHGRRARLAAVPMLECRIAVDIDNALFQKFGGNATQIRKYVYYTINEASAVFEREINVRLTVTHIKIWDTPDPYRETTESAGHLNALYNWWKLNQSPVPHDIVVGYSATYVGGRGLLGSVDTGLGYCGVVGATANNLNVATTTHEIGHLFGSAHTHDCGWPGGPIDHCAALEGNCPPEIDRNDIDTEVGTIMSYCQKAMTFHPLCREVMRTVTVASHLASINNRPVAPAVSTVAASFSVTNPVLSWPVTLQTSRYRLQLATDSSFSRLVTDTLLLVPQYHTYPLMTGIVYYWRVASTDRATGAESWSAAGRFACRAGTRLEAPTLRSPALWAKGVVTDLITWYPMAGSTAYQVQFSQTPDMQVLIAQFDRTVPSIANPFSAPNQALGAPDLPVYWRVRAVRSGEAGPWSDTHWFKQAPRALAVRPAVKDGYVGAMPIGWAVSQESDVVSTVELASSADFRAVLSRQTFTCNQVRSNPVNAVAALFDSLTDDTDYYYRIQETTADGAGPYTAGTFHTGHQRPVWHYLNAANSPLPSGGQILAKPQADGSLWVITEGALLYRNADQKTWVTYTPEQIGGRLSGSAVDLVTDRLGTVWLATNRNLYQLTDGVWHKIAYPVNESVTVSQVLTDNRGRVYVLTTTAGMLQYTNKKWTQYGGPAYPSSLYSGAVDANGVVWVSTGTSTQGIGRFDGTNWTYINAQNSGLAIGFISKLAVDSTGTELCLAGGTQLATRSGHGSWRMTDLAAINPNGDFINGIAFDRQNQLLVLSQNNIHRREGQVWKPIDGGFLTNADALADLTIGPDNRYWISASYALPGISIYDGRTLRLSPLNRSTYCAGDSLSLRVFADKLVSPGTTYAMQVRLADGTHSILPTRFTGDSVRFQLPVSLRPGNQYALRLIAPVLGITGDRTSSFVVNRLPAGAIDGAASRSYCTTMTAPLSATAEAGTYQWLQDGKVVSGSTSLTFTPGLSGGYALSITSGECSLVTPAVSLTINPAPVATAGPQSATQPYSPAPVVLVGSGNGVYQWLNSGNPIAGATNATYNASTSGQYAVQVTSTAGCTAVSAPVRVDILTPLAVEDVADYDLTISPNPSADVITIHYQLVRRSDVAMTLMDATGRIVQAQTWANQPATTHRHTVSLLVPSGMYVLTVRIGDQRITRKLLRQ